ncbi:MAG: hypothetical protein ACPGTQ_08755 [Colwellia sp.]
MKKTLETFFSNYLNAFKNYDLAAVSNCYAIPCTLNTPEKIVLINNLDSCKKEFDAIFEQLKKERMEEIRVNQSSYMAMSDDLVLTSINWQFVDVDGEVFASFCAVYHISIEKNQNTNSCKIINIASHHDENSIKLSSSFTIK